MAIATMRSAFGSDSWFSYLLIAALDMPTRFAKARSSVNNCTGRAHGIDDNTGSGVAERLITELKARGFGMWGSSNGLRSPDFDTQSLRETAELLLRGCRFNAGSGMSLHLQNGRLVETENFK